MKNLWVKFKGFFSAFMALTMPLLGAFEIVYGQRNEITALFVIGILTCALLCPIFIYFTIYYFKFAKSEDDENQVDLSKQNKKERKSKTKQDDGENKK